MIRKFRISLAGTLVSIAHMVCAKEIDTDTERAFSALDAELELEYRHNGSDPVF